MKHKGYIGHCTSVYLAKQGCGKGGRGGNVVLVQYRMIRMMLCLDSEGYDSACAI
jgi:hypothetical protein